jgi:hypothetical protein
MIKKKKLTYFITVGPLTCHQCDSRTNTKCLDSFWTDGNRTTLNTTEFLKECPTNGTVTYNSCKKTSSTNSTLQSVVRECSAVSDIYCLQGSSFPNASDPMMFPPPSKTTCYCNGPGCNGSNTLRSFASLHIFIYIAFVFFVKEKNI